MLIPQFARLLGWFLIILSFCQLFPLFLSLYLKEANSSQAFLLSIGFSFFFGNALLLSFKDFHIEEDRRVGMLVPFVLWIVIPLFAAIPFALTSFFGGFFQAYFEAVSGLTTTGATLLVDPSVLPKGLLFWRSQLEWIGGIGVFVLALTIFPLLNIGGMKLFYTGLPKGEGENINAQIKGTAQVLVPAYLMLTLLCFILLIISGESPLSASTLAMSTVSTGGFSINPGSVAIPSGGLGEWILMIFMILASLNITFFWYISRGKWPRPEQDKETFNFILLTFASGLLFFILFSTLDQGVISEVSIFSKIQTALFTAISATSTTGYVPAGGVSDSLTIGLSILFLIMIGGAMGSTAGGLKMMRAMLVSRHGWQELRKLSYRHDAKGITYNKRAITQNDLGNLWLLFFLFLLAMSFGLLFLSALGMNFHQAMNISVASITNSGPTVYLMDPEFLGYNNLVTSQKLISLLLMVFGRFEGVLILAIIAKNFWDH